MLPETIDEAILRLTTARGPGKTACPSEVARLLAPDGWRPLMEPIRKRARVLAGRGQIDITQGGEVVDAAGGFRGPIRLRVRQSG